MTRKTKSRVSQPILSFDRIAQFKARITEQEDLIYGLALLFEVLSVIYARDVALLDSYRREHLSLIQIERDCLFQASTLLAAVESGASDVSALSVRLFDPFKGSPDPKGTAARCKAMLAAFNKLFPNRSREEPFSSEETLRMAEEAVKILGNVRSREDRA